MILQERQLSARLLQEEKSRTEPERLRAEAVERALDAERTARQRLEAEIVATESVAGMPTFPRTAFGFSHGFQLKSWPRYMEVAFVSVSEPPDCADLCRVLTEKAAEMRAVRPRDVILPNGQRRSMGLKRAERSISYYVTFALDCLLRVFAQAPEAMSSLQDANRAFVFDHEVYLATLHQATENPESGYHGKVDVVVGAAEFIDGCRQPSRLSSPVIFAVEIKTCLNVRDNAPVGAVREQAILELMAILSDSIYADGRRRAYLFLSDAETFFCFEGQRTPQPQNEPHFAKISMSNPMTEDKAVDMMIRILLNASVDAKLLQRRDGPEAPERALPSAKSSGSRGGSSNASRGRDEQSTGSPTSTRRSDGPASDSYNRYTLRNFGGTVVSQEEYEKFRRLGAEPLQYRLTTESGDELSDGTDEEEEEDEESVRRRYEERLRSLDCFEEESIAGDGEGGEGAVLEGGNEAGGRPCRARARTAPSTWPASLERTADAFRR